MLLKDIKSKWHDDDEHQEFIKTILDGELVQSAKEQLDKHINDGPKAEYDWRESLLSEYLYVLALGATGSLNKTIVLTEIANNLARLEELYKLLK